MKTLRTLILLLCCISLCACGIRQDRTLLNPALGKVPLPLLPPVKPKIERLVNGQLKAGHVSYVSVYFQCLSTGYWFGINEDARFIPASLIKLPLAIGLLAMAKDNPDILQEKLRLTDYSYLMDTEFSPAKKLIPGNLYTVDELIQQALEYSDNSAADTLAVAFSMDPLNKVLGDFGFDAVTEGDFVTVKQYMTILRALYNASYLNAELSQKLLRYLTRSQFKTGIAAGLPEGVKLAHKFGEREIRTSTGSEKQLHDCGIVYYRNTPYLLGIMTKGSDMAAMSGAIREISSLIYGEVSARSARK